MGIVYHKNNGSLAISSGTGIYYVTLTIVVQLQTKVVHTVKLHNSNGTENVLEVIVVTN